MRLHVSSEAELDIFEAALRYERERAGLGIRFETQVNAVFARMLDNPRQFRMIEEGARRALPRDFPYGVFSPWTKISSRCWPCFTCIDTRTRGNDGAATSSESRRECGPRLHLVGAHPPSRNRSLCSTTRCDSRRLRRIPSMRAGNGCAAAQCRSSREAGPSSSSIAYSRR